MTIRSAPAFRVGGQNIDVHGAIHDGVDPLDLPGLGRSLYRWMPVVVADWKDFRVQPEDRAELGAVDAGVADESKQFCILLE